MKRILGYLVIAGIVAYFVLTDQTNRPSQAPVLEPVTPNWAAITAWPSLDVGMADAQPDPNRRITAIVLDDSGSMGNDIDPAKQAVVDALGAMADEDRVAVLALNAGVVLPFQTVADARAALPGLLAPIYSDGGTPLTRAIRDGLQLLEAEAAALRGFGTYRLIVTTDGQADDDVALNGAIAELAGETPIQLTTIGIGISGGHVLRRQDLGSFVDVANVSALQGALEAAVAENTAFEAISEFTAQE